MENMIVDSGDVVYYAVKVNGIIRATKYTAQMLAEQEKGRLPEDQQMIAEIVTVTADGRELLLG